jgi:hypothetical protein
MRDRSLSKEEVERIMKKDLKDMTDNEKVLWKI